MDNTSIGAFKTPVVREMTQDEYREQRRRVIAALVNANGGTRAVRSPAPRAAQS
jgi:hypothetical protein